MIHAAVLAAAAADDDLDWTVSADSTLVRAQWGDRESPPITRWDAPAAG
jgi:hypothetical protein